MSGEELWHFFGVNNSLSRLVRDKVGDHQVVTYSQKDFDDVDKWLSDLVFQSGKKHVVLYTWGLLIPKKIIDQSEKEIKNSFSINASIPVRIMEKLNNTECEFRMLYVSSESATKGSYDGTYFLSKASVEAYIRELRLKNKKSALVALAPSVIVDAGMTERRHDKENIQAAIANHPKQRLLLSSEVADACLWILRDASEYITNTVIEMNGGKFTRMN